MGAFKSPIGVPIEVPGDKSIAHRAIILSAIAGGESRLTGLPRGADVQSTLQCMRALGVPVTVTGEITRIQGVGKTGLRPTPQGAPLDCGNSGTTMRLLMGLLAGQPFASTLIGDTSLSRRPMQRVAIPLRQMGAGITLRDGAFAPVRIHPAKQILSGIDYHLPVASAQLKTALLLAGLMADSKIRLAGAIQSRDHTERLLPAYGTPLKGINLTIPGDFSSAAFWIAAACLIPNGQVEIRNVGLNPTRTGFLRILEQMGADIQTEIARAEPEPVGHVRVRYRPLRGIAVSPEFIPYLIDELPLLALIGSQAHGTVTVRGAAELRVKECDRIHAVVSHLAAMGATITPLEDGFSVTGPRPLRGATLDSFQDHRIAMTFSIASLIATGKTEIPGAECVRTSYPDFFDKINCFQ